MRVRRGYVSAGGRTIHYRVCGAGPPLVMLHDSPRSSRRYLAAMAALGDRFTVYAPDTPGYGNSQPLGRTDPNIADFAGALAQTLDALGLAEAPLYATHTSAKIALALATRGGRMPMLVLDGLSLPEQRAPDSFVNAYMRPFRIDDSGAYLAAEWSRTRDMLRWFPWFTPTPAARMAAAPASPEWMADYGIDLMSAGPHYADAYAAAMRWDPMPDLRAVDIPTLVMARRDDVLFGYLDRVPVTENRALQVERLAADDRTWLAHLRSLFAAVSPAAETPPPPAPSRSAGYLDLPHGQLHWQRLGAGDPVLVLSAPTTLQALGWARALSAGHAAIVPDLPGFGDSDPLPAPDADALADALAALVAAEADGCATVLGIGIAAPIAARLAARHPDSVRELVIDGAPPLDATRRAAFGEGLSPAIAFDPVAGSHLHRIWHLLRDGEVQWPWHDSAPGAARRLAPQIAGAALHDALTGVLKQPVHWGQAASAALAVAGLAEWRAVAVPTRLFRHSDPAFAEAAEIAGAIPDATLIERHGTLADAVAQIAGREAVLHG